MSTPLTTLPPMKTIARPTPFGAVRRVPRMLWMVFGLLAMNFTIVGITVTRATGDPHMAVEPDYYQRAVAWDESVRAGKASDVLGWSVVVESAIVPGDPVSRVVTLRLADADGQPVTEAIVEVCVFHHAFARTRIEIICEEVGGGVYRARMAATRPGLHEVQIQATRGEDRFEHDASFVWAG